jgi:hypothetical protein
MVMSEEEAAAAEDSLLVLLVGLLEAAVDLASRSDLRTRLLEISRLCNDAESVALLAVSLAHHQGDDIPAPPA